jgi:hypothetical protein
MNMPGFNAEASLPGFTARASIYRTVSTPPFTTEASLYNAPGVPLINRNGTSLNSRDVVIPQYQCYCGYGCSCWGFEDCSQMVYDPDNVCWGGQPSAQCSWDSTYGIVCWCPYACV